MGHGVFIFSPAHHTVGTLRGNAPEQTDPAGAGPVGGANTRLEAELGSTWSNR